jgi:hypothetical protein
MNRVGEPLQRSGIFVARPHTHDPALQRSAILSEAVAQMYWGEKNRIDEALSKTTDREKIALLWSAGSWGDVKLQRYHSSGVARPPGSLGPKGDN